MANTVLVITFPTEGIDASANLRLFPESLERKAADFIRLSEDSQEPLFFYLLSEDGKLHETIFTPHMSEYDEDCYATVRLTFTAKDDPGIVYHAFYSIDGTA